MACWDDFGI